MNLRTVTGLTAAGAITFAAVLVGSGHTFAQEPVSSPAPAAMTTPMMGEPAGMSAHGTADQSPMWSMMGQGASHMMAAPMFEHGHRGDESPGHGMDSWGPSGHEGWMHAMPETVADACLAFMREMAPMMESMMSGTMMSGVTGMGMGLAPDASPGPTTPTPSQSLLPAPSAAPTGIDHAAHHAPAASPAP